jgi:hypothetical protein
MPTSAGRLRRSLGARQGVSVVMDSVESVKAASGARVRSRCASVSRMAWLSWPLWVLGHEDMVAEGVKVFAAGAFGVNEGGGEGGEV